MKIKIIFAALLLLSVSNVVAASQAPPREEPPPQPAPVSPVPSEKPKPPANVPQDPHNIPLPDYGENWEEITFQDPGNWKEVRLSEVGLPPNNQELDAGKLISDLAASAEGNTIFVFDAGSYWMKSRMTIAKSGIRLRGAGSEKTLLYQIGPKKENTILFTGRLGDIRKMPLIEPYPSAAGKTLQVKDSSGINVGDMVDVFHTKVDGKEKPRCDLRGRIARVISVSSGTVELDRPVLFEMNDKTAPALAVYRPIENVGLEGVFIDKVSNTDDETIRVAYGRNLLFRDIHSIYTSKSHLTFWACDTGVVEDCRFHHSWDYGEGGHAYGISFYAKTTRIRASNNALWMLRHSTMLTYGASFNVISYNYLRSSESSRDERFHGLYAMANLYEGNDALDIAADSAHERNGKFNTIFRNRANWIGRLGKGPYASESPFVVSANVIIEMPPEGSYLGGNVVLNEMDWQQMPHTTMIPPSLYAKKKPTFLGDLPFPVFGPDVKGYGMDIQIPAKTLFTKTPETPVRPPQNTGRVDRPEGLRQSGVNP